MRGLGYVLLGLGASWLLYALSIDTSVAVPGGWGRVQNLSLMEARRTHLMLSGGSILVGVLLLGFSRLQRTSDDDDLDEDADYRDCPFCAEPVRVEAVMCRHCRSALPAVVADEVEPDEELEVAATVDEESDAGRSYSYRDLRAAAEAAERQQ